MPWVNVGTTNCVKGEYTSLGSLVYNRPWVVRVNNFSTEGVRLWGVALGLAAFALNNDSTLTNAVYFANRIYNQTTYFSAVSPAQGAGLSLFWYTPVNSIAVPNVTFWRLDP